MKVSFESAKNLKKLHMKSAKTAKNGHIFIEIAKNRPKNEISSMNAASLKTALKSPKNWIICLQKVLKHPKNENMF